MGAINCCGCGAPAMFQPQQPSYANSRLQYTGCYGGPGISCCDCSNTCFGMGTCLGCYRCCGGSNISIYSPPPIPIYR